jgi:hypothetical protein
MNKLIVLFVVIGVGSLFLGYKVTADERESVKVPLDNYLQGQSTGNPEFMRKAFYADARIMAFRDGKVMSLSVEEFAGRFNGKPAEDEAQRKRRIESIDVSGNAASAKIVLDYPNVKLTDYMNLLKIDGEWKIVNKSFSAEPKQKPAK